MKEINKRKNEVNSSSPGPGEYEASVRTVKKNIPKYVFGKPKDLERSNKNMSFSPGPGQYNAPSLKTDVAFTMGVRNNSQKTLHSSNSFSIGDDTFLKK